MTSATKINIFTTNKNNPMKNLTKTIFAAAFGALMLAFSQNASAVPHPLPPIINLTIGDTHELGQIEAAVPHGMGDRLNYVKFILALAPLGSGHDIIASHDNLVTRTGNVFANLPEPTLAAFKNGGTNIIDLGAGGTFDYLFAKYDGPHGGAFVWFVGDLSGIINIPLLFQDKHLGGWTLFGVSASTVPDGGPTVLLLGVGLMAIGAARQWVM
jgi:hypothetical protein